MHYNGFREVRQNGRDVKILHAVHIRLDDGSPEGLQDLPSDFNVPGIPDVNCNGFREVIQNGSQARPLHTVHIKLEDGSPEGLQDFPYELGHHSKNR